MLLAGGLYHELNEKRYTSPSYVAKTDFKALEFLPTAEKYSNIFNLSLYNDTSINGESWDWTIGSVTLYRECVSHG